MTWASGRSRHIHGRFAVLAVIVAMSGHLFPEQRAASADREAVLTRSSRPFDRVTVPLPSGWRTLRVSEPADVIDLVNFPAEEQIRGTVIPPGGARVTVLLTSQSTSAQTKMDSDERANGLTLVPRKLQGVPFPATEDSWAGTADTGSSGTLAFYVELPTDLQCVYATYQGEPAARLARRTAVSIICGVRLAGTARGMLRTPAGRHLRPFAPLTGDGSAIVLRDG